MQTRGVANIPLSQQEIHEILDYIDEKIGSDKILKSQETKIFTDFCKENAPHRKPRDVINQIHKLLESDSPHIERHPWSKVKWLYVLSIPVDEDFAENLKQDAILKLDAQGRINSVFSKDGIHAFGPTTDKKMQIRKLADFVAKYCRRHSKVETNHMKMVNEYRKVTEGNTMSTTILQRRLSEMKRDIHLYTWLDVQTRVRMLYVMDVAVEADFLELLRKDAVVIISDNNRITGYRAFDRSLKLGDVEDSESSDSEDIIILDVLPSSLLKCVKEEPGLGQMIDYPMMPYLEYQGPTSIPLKQEVENDDWIQKTWRRTVKQESPEEEVYDYVMEEYPMMDYFGTSSEPSSSNLTSSEASTINGSNSTSSKTSEASTISATSSESTYTSGSSSSVILKSPSTSTSSEESESIDVKKYLNILHCLILTIDSPILSETEQKLQKSISENSRKIPLQDVIFSLEIILRLVVTTQNSNGDSDDDQKTSVSIRTILTLLMNLVFYLGAPQKTSDLLMKIRKALESGDSEKKIPIKTLQSALDTTLLLIAS